MPVKLPYDLKRTSQLIEALGIGQLLVTVVFCSSIGLELFGMSGLAPELLQLLARIWQGTIVAILVVVIFWVFRAAANAASITPDSRWIRPWWTVIWWFIPFFNLWQPIRAMSQIWNTSVDVDMDLNGPAAPAVTSWWLLFLFGPALAGITAGTNPEGPYMFALIMLMLAGSTAALLTIVRCVPAGQIEKVRRVSSEPSGQPVFSSTLHPSK